MLRSARFALFVGLGAAIPVAARLDPPRKQDQEKQQTKDPKKKVAPAKVGPAKQDSSPGERLDRRNSRMKERNREIDGLVNKPKQ
ncbi:MAG: hypothetical protein LAO55_01100 [Acidobacteriia bacterium]|nr:hypothetical protein [Terriglobia bacterium]